MPETKSFTSCLSALCQLALKPEWTAAPTDSASSPSGTSHACIHQALQQRGAAAGFIQQYSNGRCHNKNSVVLLRCKPLATGAGVNALQFIQLL